MPFKSFRDFTEYTELQNSDYIVGYREVEKEYKTTIENIATFLSRNVLAAPNVLYVNLSGKDTNSGTSEASAMRTIKRACAKALDLSRRISLSDRLIEANTAWGVRSQSVNIFVRAGNYIEDNPIYLPPGCTIIGDNLRAVTIIPKNKFYDIIWINPRCYVWGVTFRQHKNPSYAIAYPSFQFLSGSLVPSVEFSLERPLYNQSTRVREATALTTQYYRDHGFNVFGQPAHSYSTTRRENTNKDNLSDDFGGPLPGEDAITPFQVAFMTRYFRDLSNDFFTEGEIDFETEFWHTLWYRANVRRPFTLTSPYPQGNSSITQSTLPGMDNAGGGVLVDGDEVDGPLRSMVMDSFTQFNEGGKGIHIINNGYAQLVSTFTICCTEGVICESGGTCSINTSNCSFGLSGLVAKGKSPRPALIGQLQNPITSSAINQVVVRGLGNNINRNRQQFRDDFQPYPGQVFEIISRSQVLQSTGQPLSARNGGTFFTILSASPIFRLNPSDTDFASVIQLELNYTLTDDTTIPFEAEAALNNPITTIVAGPQTDVIFYIRSTITTSAHTMEYIGTGTSLLSAVPQRGGQTDVSLEVVQDDIGRVFFTVTNQFGDFRIGPGLTIVQATGTIEGDTFRRSLLQTITPFTIALAT